VQRLMRVMGLEAIHPKPRPSLAGKGWNRSHSRDYAAFLGLLLPEPP
jgi:hypothetical protein